VPCDRKCTGDRQSKAEEESENEVGMRELFDTFLDREQELPLGSIPPVAPALAISSAGFAPNAAEDEKPRKAMTTMILARFSARLRRRLE
jgi:hypothetical protein